MTPRIRGVSATCSVAIFGTALEEFTDKNIGIRPKFPYFLYVLSHLLVARLILSGDIPSLLLHIFITCTGITSYFTFASFTELGGTVFYHRDEYV